MRVAPIQMNQLSFRRVNVELDVKRFGKGEFEKFDRPFAFEKVVITTHVGFAPTEESTSSSASFLITLQVVIDNQPPDNGEVPRLSPYLIDVEVGAVVRVAKGAEALGDVQDLAVVNGTSLLWSAIREQVCNLTARMPAGMATLPTMNFHDLRKAQQKKSDEPKPTPSPGKRPGTKASAKPAESKK